MSTPLDLMFTDPDGDRCTIIRRSRPNEASVLVSAPGMGTYLDRDQVLELYHALGDHIMATNNTAEAVTTPDATADGYAWPQAEQPESVALEAHGHVYGDRQTDYGHPREDFTRTAILWTALLQHKLADGAYVEAEDIGRCMIAVKLSRDVNSPKRDNRVDMAGYAITLDRLETGR